MYALALPRSTRSGCPHLDNGPRSIVAGPEGWRTNKCSRFSILTALTTFLQVYVKKIAGFKDEAGFMDKAGVSGDAA